MTDLTIKALIKEYRTDKISPYQKLRNGTRLNYDSNLRRIDLDRGSFKVADIKKRTLLEWHAEWCKRGVPQAHALMTALRILMNYGTGLLEDDKCAVIASLLRTMKFENCSAREHILTAEMVELIRAEAHRQGCPSIALAQAIQFEGMLRQRDVLGEWTPLREPGVSDITSLGEGKWLRGIRWNEVDADLWLEHVTSKKNKKVAVDLKLAPMVLEELGAIYCDLGEPLTRAKLPASGPIIVDEDTGLPWIIHKFRKRWREIARKCGIPDAVQNRDSRAGAITEALSYGASKDDVRKAAAHSTSQMTERYSRDQAAASARSASARVAGRAQKNERKDEVA